VKRNVLLAPLLFLLLSTSQASLAADPDRIDHPEKIGVGTWKNTTAEQMLSDVERVGASWFYPWQPENAAGSPKFVPMIWGGSDAEKLQVQKLRRPAILLTFNEPDHTDQANLSVEQALNLWPKLMATGAARLGSPATTMGGTLGPDSWLGRFMREAESRDYKVDFINVHYYPTDPDVCAFRDFLKKVHEAYRRPVWVTEWALADWQHPGKFTADEQSAFILSAAYMMDDLPFVERHAWFAAYELENLGLNSGLLNLNSALTSVGKTFWALTSPKGAGRPATRCLD
jgi:hypothetical protein